jgi:hypothetical protein
MNKFSGSAWDLTYVQGIFSEAAFTGSTSAFGTSWNQAFIPYCTGDVHAGNKLQTYTTSGGGKVTAYHKGWNNFNASQGDLVKIGGYFSPTKVAVWGASAGGMGADCNLGAIQAHWPTLPMYEMNNSGTPFSYFYTNPSTVGETWGTFAIAVPPIVLTCPFVLGAWSPNNTAIWNDDYLTTVRKAFVDDYRDLTINYFSNLASCGTGYDPNSCDVEPQDSVDFLSQQLAGESNYKVYAHVGSCHAEREDNGGRTECNYDTQVAHGVNFKDWVRGWMQVSGYSWNTVSAQQVRGNLTVQSGSSPQTWSQDVIVGPYLDDTIVGYGNVTVSGTLTVN